MINRIMDFTVNDFMMFEDFGRLAKEAQDAYNLISRAYTDCFGLGKKEIKVITRMDSEYDGYGYLTVDGMFKYHDNWWGGRDWTVDCSGPDGIFKVFKYAYIDQLRELYSRNGDNGFVRELESMVPNHDSNLYMVAPYLRAWITQVKEGTLTA